MLLQGSIKAGRLGCLLLAMLLAAGCASGPAKSDKTADASQGGSEFNPDVPPEAQVQYEQAVAVMAAGNTIDAELRLQEFLLQYPNYPGAHVNLAIIFADRDDLEGAEASLTDALIIDPEHPEALNQLGVLLRRQGKFPEAENAYLKAITASPDYALAHYNLAVLNDLYTQKLDVALQHYEHYQALVGDDQQVSKWIADLKRRISAGQRTANVTE